ncbi:MAG: winged helix-turn-helix transcriptional regulator [Planctomycetes bacterium]|nr:winged helix-turn-helix transcriptional regulator [Planctomycetota bacterium]
MTDETKKLAAEAIGSCLATRLRLATRVVTKLYDAALRPFGVTVSQLALLAVAADRGAIRQFEVGPLLQLDDSTLSRNLDRMRTNGWLEKVEEEDARVHTHRLTESGRGLFERVMPAWRGAQARANELLGEAGVQALNRFASENGFGS